MGFRNMQAFYVVYHWQFCFVHIGMFLASLVPLGAHTADEDDLP